MEARRVHLLATALLAASAAVSCGGKNNSNNSGGGASGGESSGNGGGARSPTANTGFLRLREFQHAPPALNWAECSGNMNTALNQYRKNGQAFHFGPACTNAVSGLNAAVFATGTPDEATDIWVVLNPTGTPEVHRVRRTPVGVKFTDAAIKNGYVYLLGEAPEARDELPAHTPVTAVFPIPGQGGGDPEVLDLSVAELALLDARTRADVTTRANNLQPLDPPAADAARQVVEGVISGGATALTGALPRSGDVPVLRGWESGAYERLGTINAQTPASDATLSAAVQAIQSLTADHKTLDCDLGDRCLSKPTSPPSEPPDAVVVSQVLLRKEGSGVVIAAIIEQGRRSDAMSTPSSDPLRPPVDDDPADKQLVETYTLDGTIEGHVESVMRGPAKIIAFGVARGNTHYDAAFVITAPNRAPRRVEDNVFYGLTTGARQPYIRDVDRNLEPELYTVTHLASPDIDVVGVSTLLWPPAIPDRVTFPRIDPMRAAIDAHNVADAERLLQRYNAPPYDQAAVCALVDRIAEHPPTPLAPVAGGFVTITYATEGHPLRGNITRLAPADLRTADTAHLLGPFAGVHCADLTCDPFQGYCKKTENGHEVGYLWIAPGTGRRPAPALWGVSTLQH